MVVYSFEWGCCGSQGWLLFAREPKSDYWRRWCSIHVDGGCRDPKVARYSTHAIWERVAA